MRTLALRVLSFMAFALSVAGGLHEMFGDAPITSVPFALGALSVCLSEIAGLRERRQ